MSWSNNLKNTRNLKVKLKHSAVPPRINEDPCGSRSVGPFFTFKCWAGGIYASLVSSHLVQVRCCCLATEASTEPKDGQTDRQGETCSLQVWRSRRFLSSSHSPLAACGGSLCHVAWLGARSPAPNRLLLPPGSKGAPAALGRTDGGTGPSPGTTAHAEMTWSHAFGACLQLA